MSKNTEKTDVYEIVTERVIASLEAGVVPWHQPWTESFSYPRSMSTNKVYRGINVWLLSISAQLGGYTSAYWGTYNNITEAGGNLKGAKSTPVTLWKTFRKKDAEGVEKTHFVLRYYNVFNADQADWGEAGMPKKYRPEVTPVRDVVMTVEAADAMVDAYLADGPDMREGTSAYYQPSCDTVTMPERTSFLSTERYYSTLFHELSHSTGHSTRLNREGVTNVDRFGSHQYAAEELIAEMSAAFLCGISGVTLDVEQNAAYIANWLQVFKGDRKILVQAAGKAQKAADKVAGINWDVEAAPAADEAMVAA